MYKVIGNSSFLSIFSDLSVEVAGKSGTAQENALRPDHGLFVCFAPYDDPEITVTVVLPYGYGSYNSGSVAKICCPMYSTKMKQPMENVRPLKSMELRFLTS